MNFRINSNLFRDMMEEKTGKEKGHFVVQYRESDGRLIAPIMISIAKKAFSSDSSIGFPLKAFALACGCCCK